MIDDGRDWRLYSYVQCWLVDSAYVTIVSLSLSLSPSLGCLLAYLRKDDTTGQLDATSPVTLGTPGLSTFSAQSITLGGAQTTGPISIAGGAGEIEVLSPSDVAVTAGTGAVFNVAGASVAVRAPTVSLEAPAGSNNLSANRVTLYGGVFLANTMQACHIF